MSACWLGKLTDTAAAVLLHYCCCFNECWFCCWFYDVVDLNIDVVEYKPRAGKPSAMWLHLSHCRASVTGSTTGAHTGCREAGSVATQYYKVPGRLQGIHLYYKC